MAHKFDEGKELIIEAVIGKLKHKENGKKTALCAEFIRQFFGTVSLDDLREWTIDDLYGAAANFWSLIQTRGHNEIKIRIYNPEFAQDGWQTTHTVVEVICEDRPFLVDSLRMVINRMGFALHLIIHMGGIRLARDKAHQVSAILPRFAHDNVDSIVEAPLFLEIDRQTDPKVLKELHQQFMRALEENVAVVEDWSVMRERVHELITELEIQPNKRDPDEVEETKAFLSWIENHHFTFLGVRDYALIKEDDDMILRAIPDTGLGVLRENLTKSSARSISAMSPEARELTTSQRILLISKTNTLASVHRDAYTDYIGVKRFNAKGEVIGERRILGLYTSAAYNTNPKHIPFLRHKVASVMRDSCLNPRSHAGRVLVNILETLPRDDLIQASEEELLAISMGIFYMQERRRIRMFARMDLYRRFISCLVYVPKDLFNTELRKAMEAVLSESFQAQEITFSTYFSESVLARIHFIIRIDPQGTTMQYDFKAVEKKLIEVGRSWTDDLQYFLIEAYGEEKANQLFARYKNVFPVGYTTIYPPRTAVIDIKQIESLTQNHPLGMNFYRPLDDHADNFRLKIYQHDTTIALSDVLPIIEKLGMRAISERPYMLTFDDGKVTWINEFLLHYPAGMQLQIEDTKALFQHAFLAVWFHKAENDGFNQLVLSAGLSWRQVSVLRMYAKYFKQIGLTFSQEYIELALNNNPGIAKKLVEFFELRFHPKPKKDFEKRCNMLVNSVLTDLDTVANLDEDRIIRLYTQAITCTLRTNYYQFNEEDEYKSYLSIKLRSKDISGIPRPYPMFEVFVYSPHFEGVHLRGGKVARGGIRWSDRKEDFRTEILGLMKAQQVKNAVIVPQGAKGGFVIKTALLNATREEILTEGIRCYEQFIRGLFDITDNLYQGEVIPPEHVVCYDEKDAYLVVAADKGTATFSDIANAISKEYAFWLGDAFASGGSIGYDHKKMGITARGAWESVKRHFLGLGLDVSTTDFTVVGIGDMSGDVFGNGMLLSQHIKLVAAFNHIHIFIDPSPDPQASFEERQRLFNAPGLTWADYDKKLISKGGGVFNRNAKSIIVSKEMKQLLNIKQNAIEPNELIKLILRAKVDLLWSGGIGTFVKAQTETHADVGDRTNDAIRVNAKQLRCKVVAEGGNLGLTQLARVEYALNNGLIYTDFIDNSGGVSCSDKEVNIKILLNAIVQEGDLTEKQRQALLMAMTDDVAQLVLRENYLQTRAISFLVYQAQRSLELYSRYINHMEQAGKINRRLEFLPTEKELLERKTNGKSLTSPEIAVLLCYSKIDLKEQILASNVPEDSYLLSFLTTAFPKALQKKYIDQMGQHPLKREIIATKISNIIVNEMGFSFVYRLQDETGASVSAIVRAYLIARDILDLETVWFKLEATHCLTAAMQLDIITMYVRILRRFAGWFLRSHRMQLDITQAIKQYGLGVREFKKILVDTFSDELRRQYDEQLHRYVALGVPDAFASELVITNGVYSALDIVEVSQTMSVSVARATSIYVALGTFLDINWLRNQIIIHTTDSHWEALSREALRDDLDGQQRQLTESLISLFGKRKEVNLCIEEWAQLQQGLIARWRHVLANLRASTVLTYTMFFVAIRELLDLTQTTVQLSNNHHKKEEQA